MGKGSKPDDDSDESDTELSLTQLKSSKEIEKEIENFGETQKLLEETSKLLEGIDDVEMHDNQEMVKNQGLSLVNDFMKQTSLSISPPLSPLRISSELPSPHKYLYRNCHH